MSKNDFGFGYSWLHQANTNGSFPYTLANGTTYNTFGNNPPLYLATASYFVRDTWTPNEKFSAIGSFWLQRSLDTSSTHFDPRVSLVYRPDSADVIRLTGGRSYSEPDPSLLAFAPPVYGAPSSINCPPATSGTGALVSIASVANPTLQPETAGDLELAYGHRFNCDDEHSGRRLSIAREPSAAQRQRLDRRLPGDHRSERLYRQGARAPELMPGPASDDP